MKTKLHKSLNDLNFIKSFKGCKILVAFFLLVVSKNISAQDTIKLFVYGDANNNCVYDAGEQPLTKYILSFNYFVNSAPQTICKVTDNAGKCTIVTYSAAGGNTLSCYNANLNSATSVSFSINSCFSPTNLTYNTSTTYSVPISSSNNAFIYSKTSGFLIVPSVSTNLPPGYKNFCIGQSAFNVNNSSFSYVIGTAANSSTIQNYVHSFHTLSFLAGSTTSIDVANFTGTTSSSSFPCYLSAVGNGGYTQFTNPELSIPGTYTVTLSTTNVNDIGFSQTFTLIVDSCANSFGTEFVDCNNDCMKNSTEFSAPNVQYVSTNGTYTTYAYPDYNGNYSLISPASSIPYTLNVSPGAGLTNTCFSSPTNTYIATGSGINLSLYDVFKQTTLNPINAYAICNTQIGSAIPGSTFSIKPYYGISNPEFCSVYNHNGMFWVKLPPLMNIQGTTTPAYSSIFSTSTGDSIVWNMSDIRTKANNLSGIFFNLPIFTATNAVIGNNFCISSGIVTNYTETTISDNMNTYCGTVMGPYDPNDKHVSPKGTGSQGTVPLTTNEFIYHINFQNVGNSPAINVKVKDQLDQNLDFLSLQVLGSSHPVKTNVSGTGFVDFLFDKIFLMDSTHNEPASHGFVTYKVSVKPNLSAGTQIKNYASIYFDYNAPVITNTVVNTLNTIVTDLKGHSHNSDINLYPNPTTGNVFINSKGSIFKVNVMNALGQLVLSKEINSMTAELDLSTLEKGIYLVHITTSNGTLTKKVVKE